jgi:hypothetical protein
MNSIASYFSKVQETKNGWKAECPRCHHGGMTFSFSEEKSVACCFFSECLWHPSKGGVSLPRLRAFFSLEGVEEKQTEVIQVSETADVKLPEEFELIEKMSDPILKEDLLSYFASRGIHKKLVYKAKVGYISEGKLWGYLIFPCFDNGECVWWQGRRYKNRTPKFFNPPSSRKNDLLYGINQVKRPKRIVLVESIFNVLTLDTPYESQDLIRGLLGKTMSEQQMDRILCYERHCEEIVVALDPDAIRDAVEIASRLIGIIPCVRVPIFPEGQDVNSLGREKAWDIIRSAEPYSERNRMKFLQKGKT